MRYLLLAVIVGVVIWYWRRSSLARPAVPPESEPPAQRMVQCARCGVYLPLADALPGGDAYYCSREHLEERRSEGGH